VVYHKLYLHNTGSCTDNTTPQLQQCYPMWRAKHADYMCINSTEFNPQMVTHTSK